MTDQRFKHPITSANNGNNMHHLYSGPAARKRPCNLQETLRWQRCLDLIV